MSLYDIRLEYTGAFKYRIDTNLLRIVIVIILLKNYD